MPVNIHISGDTAAEALKELAALAGPLGGAQAAPASTETPKSSRSSRSTPKADPKPEQEQPPVQNKPAQEEQSDEEPEDDGSPIPTVVELRAKAQEVGTTPKAKQAIKALLDEFGSKSISDVPEDKRRSFMVKLEELAAPIDISDDDLPY